MSDEPALRWGILSTARIARALVPALARAPGNELVAVASRDLDRAEAFAREWQAPRAYGSYDELLAADDIDVIYNPLPNHLHAELTVAAAAAGKHVLCEKPLALTVEEVDAIATAAAANQVVVAEAFMYRHHPQTLWVQEHVASGGIGTPRTVRGSFTFTLTAPGDVRLDPAMGGGSLWDVGCYPLSYARTVLAEEPVEAAGWASFGPTGVDLGFWGTVRFPSGAVAQLDCGFAAPLRAHLEVVGSEGVVVVPQPYKPGDGEVVLVGPDGDSLQEQPVPGADLYRGEVEDLAEAIRTGRPPRVTLEDSRANTAAILALLRSAAEGGHPVPV